MKARLQEIRDRADKAKGKQWHSTQALDNYGEPTDAFHVYDVPIPYSSETVCYVCNGNEDDDRNNAEFIAHAPADIKFLLDALQDAEDALNKANCSIKGINSHYGTNLEVYNWHLNGQPEPFDNFLEDNGLFEAEEITSKVLGHDK